MAAAPRSARASPPPHQAGTVLQLCLLGQPAWREGVQRDAQPLGPRLAVLLALLALEGPQSRARAAELLYPHQDSAAARRNLRQLLFGQRTLLERLLDQRGERLALRDCIGLDLRQEPDAQQQPQPLLGSLRFDDAPALQDWLERQRERQRQQQQEALAALASTEEAAGRLAHAIVLAQRLVELNPASEHAHRRLMRLHYLRGDRAAALAAFDHCERLLRDELSARPGAETLALLAQIESAEAPAPLRSRPAPAAMLRPPRLVGRDAEWARLRECWRDGGGLLLLGEPGMGKSRLLSDLTLVEPGCLLLSAQAGDDALPYALLSRLLRRLLADYLPQPSASLRRELARLLPELGDAPPLGGEAELARFFNALQLLLGQALQQGLSGFALDDLHFADAASLAALPGVLGQPGIRWLAAARPAELGAGTQQALLALSQRAALQLAPLSAAAVAELLASLGLQELQALDAAELHRQCGGNPLFLLECLKHRLTQDSAVQRGSGPQGSPSRVGELIMQRIGRLSMSAVQLARCAALAGPDFSAALAAHVLGCPPIELTEPWAELEAAQILRDGAFAHDLVREAAIASVPPAIARVLHAQIAEFLSNQTSTPAARLAVHWQAAQHWDAAAAAYLRAAGFARQTLRRLEETQWLRLAVDCAKAAGNAQAEFESALALAEAALCESLGPEVPALAQQALQLAPDESAQLRALAVLAAAMTQRIDDHGPQRTACERGITLARQLGQPALAMQLALPLAGSLLNARHITQALSLLEPLRDWAEQAAEPAQLCDYYDMLGTALDYANRLVESAQVHERQCELARRHGLHEATATALFSLGSTLAKRGGLRAAVQVMEKGLQLTRSQQQLAGQVLHRQATLGWRYRDLGEYRPALALMEDALAGLRQSGPGSAAAFNVCHRLALAYAQLGQHARARQTLQRYTLADDEPHARRALWLSHSAELRRLAGDRRLAREEAEQALALLDGQRDDMPFRVVCLQACLLLEPDAGEAMAAGLAGWSAAHERFGLALSAHLRALDCALRAASPARVRGHLEAARGLAQRFDSELIYRGEYWLQTIQALRQLGDEPAAHEALTQAGHWLQRILSEQLPEEFVDSFLQRNAVNVELRRLAAPAPGEA